MQKYKIYDAHQVVFTGANEQELVKYIESHFSEYSLISAAGGIVKNNDEHLLLIERNGWIDLPKGKIEANEQPQHAALREVEEECGIDGLKIIDDIPLKTYHIYEQKNIRYLKTTYWYIMQTSFKGTLIPQIEEQITKVFWCSIEEFWNNYSNKSYPLISDLISIWKR